MSSRRHSPDYVLPCVTDAEDRYLQDDAEIVRLLNRASMHTDDRQAIFDALFRQRKLFEDAHDDAATAFEQMRKPLAALRPKRPLFEFRINRL